MEQEYITPQGENDGFSAALNGILSNPEMLSMISSMAQKLKSGAIESDVEADTKTPTAPQTQGAEGESVPSTQSAEAIPASLPNMLGSLAPLLSGELGSPSRESNNRACLLRALKPYMSDGRSEAIEYIIKFSRLTELLKSLR